MTQTIKEEFIKACKNRQCYLEKKFKEWKNSKTERDKAKIIITLIQLEPSHLAEAWILDQVIKWMKNHEKNIDYLQEAFIVKGDRDILTKKQRENLARTTFLYFKLKNLTNEKGSQGKAIREFILNSEDEKLAEEPETALKQKLKRYRKKIDKRALPYPYYGLDCAITYNEEGQRCLEFYTFNKPITIKGVPIFGNTTIKYPIKK